MGIEEASVWQLPGHSGYQIFIDWNDPSTLFLLCFYTESRNLRLPIQVVSKYKELLVLDFFFPLNSADHIDQ